MRWGEEVEEPVQVGLELWKVNKRKHFASASPSGLIDRPPLPGRFICLQLVVLVAPKLRHLLLKCPSLTKPRLESPPQMSNYNNTGSNFLQRRTMLDSKETQELHHVAKKTSTRLMMRQGGGPDISVLCLQENKQNRQNKGFRMSAAWILHKSRALIWKRGATILLVWRKKKKDIGFQVCFGEKQFPPITASTPLITKESLCASTGETPNITFK